MPAAASRLFSRVDMPHYWQLSPGLTPLDPGIYSDVRSVGFPVYIHEEHWGGKRDKRHEVGNMPPRVRCPSPRTSKAINCTSRTRQRASCQPASCPKATVYCTYYLKATSAGERRLGLIFPFVSSQLSTPFSDIPPRPGRGPPRVLLSGRPSAEEKEAGVPQRQRHQSQQRRQPWRRARGRRRRRQQQRQRRKQRAGRGGSEWERWGGWGRGRRQAT